MSEITKLLQHWNYENNTLMHDALECAALGLRVFPLAKRSKVPLIERWPDRATSDGPTIVKWFESWPEANLAIATGGGLFVVDVDPRNGGSESFGQLVRRRKWPDTAHARTGNDGDHYLFRSAGTQRIPTITGWKAGIDIKGEGGYVAVEPSIHPITGKEYAWMIKPKSGIADAPSWLLSLLEARPSIPLTGKSLSPTRDGDGAALLADMIASFPIQRRGQRHVQMRGVVGHLLGKNHKPDLVEAVAIAWNSHFYAMGVIGTPPHEAEREIRACINSTLKNPKFQPAIGADHRAAIGRICLTCEQKACIDRGVITPTGLILASPHCIRVTREHELCRTGNERLFVEALTIYFTYKVVHRAEFSLKATNDQIRWPIVDRHGREWANKTYDREFEKYVTRPGKPATRFELAIQTVKGHQNVASEYELTGLVQLLPPEAAESI